MGAGILQFDKKLISTLSSKIVERLPLRVVKLSNRNRLHQDNAIIIIVIIIIGTRRAFARVVGNRLCV